MNYFALDIHFSTGELILIYAFTVAWYVSFGLALANLFLISFLRVRFRWRFINQAMFMIYILSGCLVVTGVSQSAILLFGAPTLTICHFIALLWARRQVRLRESLA